VRIERRFCCSFVEERSSEVIELMSLHRFGEDICDHVLSWCVDYGEVGLVSVSEEEVSNIDMFCSLKCWFIVPNEVN
jgi:hypothetical protein